MTKNFKPKIVYLELLLENPDGITPSDVSEIYLEDVTNEAANNALRRLKKSKCATREIVNGEFLYKITDRGVLKYNHLKSQEE